MLANSNNRVRENACQKLGSFRLAWSDSVVSILYRSLEGHDGIMGTTLHCLDGMTQ